MTDRLCCCGCGQPATMVLARHGDRAIDLAFARKCRAKYDAAAEHFRRTCETCCSMGGTATQAQHEEANR